MHFFTFAAENVDAIITVFLRRSNVKSHKLYQTTLNILVNISDETDGQLLLIQRGERKVPHNLALVVLRTR